MALVVVKRLPDEIAMLRMFSAGLLVAMQTLKLVANKASLAPRA